MKTPHSSDITIPPALLAEVLAAAQDEHRPTAEVVHDALERYLTDWRKNRTPSRTSSVEAVARMRAFHKIPLPVGMTIETMIADGRA